MAYLWILWLILVILVLVVGLIVWDFVRAGDQSRPRDLKTVLDLRRQSVLLPGPERARAATWGSPRGDPEQLLRTTDSRVSTIYDNFLRGKEVSGDGFCMGARESVEDPYKWISFGDALDHAHMFASGLIQLGIQHGQSTFIGIYAANCPEWQITALGLVSQSMVVVPLYDTLGPASTAYIINQATIPLVVCDTMDKAELLLGSAPNTPTLKHVVVMRGGPTSLSPVHHPTIQVHSLAGLLSLGQTHPATARPPRPQDLYIVCYTSGTTGNPKGVMLAHETVIADAACFQALVRDYTGSALMLQPGDIMVSYLPLAHMFEQLLEVVMFYFGARIGFFSGNIRHLNEDMQALRPVVVPAVPRVLNRMRDQIMAAVKAGGLPAKLLFNLGYGIKRLQIARGIYRRDTIWDKLIFGKVQKQLGSNMLFMLTGSAPVSGKVLNLCRVALGCPIFEGYGQTECTAGCTFSLPNDLTTGHVGPPLPACHVKLVDVPELEYYAKDGKGEVCIRGPIVMKGYFREPEKTAEALDADGWLHSGDVGTWLPNGSLKIIDRKKHIFKLAQGEYVAPEKIEEVYSRCDLISQIFVDGNSEERFLVAVAIPHERELRRLADREGLAGGGGDDFLRLCGDPAVRQAVLLRLQKVGKAQQLNSMEQVQAIHLTTDRWSLENGFLTPTMKTKRPQLRAHYRDIIAGMYREANKNQ